MKRPLLIGTLLGALSVGLVGPAEAPTAVASTGKQQYGFSGSQQAQKAYKHYAWVRLGRDRKAFACLNELWTHESGWRPKARASVPVGQRYAAGIPQLVGLNHERYNAYTQIELGLIYLQRRYGGQPCRAWTHWQRQERKRGYGWY